MPKITGTILIFLCITVILATGCISPGTTSTAPAATPTPTTQIVYVTVLVTPTPMPIITPASTVAPAQDPIIGVWRCSDSSGYDRKIRFNADHTFIESWHNPDKPDIYKGTWRALGQNSYETIDDEFHLPDKIVYSPSRNVIYSKDIPTFVLSPYAGDVEAAK